VLPTTIAVVQFPDVQKATEAVIDVMNKGVGIRTFPGNFLQRRFIILSFRMRRTRRQHFYVSNQQSRNLKAQMARERFSLFQIPRPIESFYSRDGGGG
jgi:hypothetical protein